MRDFVRHNISAGASWVLAFALPLGLATLPAPVAAQIAVFDPHNYSQNLLTAARTLQTVNNQIRSLQNEAAMLLNQAKNLSRVDFPEVQALTQRLQQIDQLMGQAQDIRLRVTGLDEQFRRLFPRGDGQPLSVAQQVAAAQTRLDAAMTAYEHTLTVQAGIAENVGPDAATLASLVNRSQGAEGALQVGQATNQLLALTAKQQLQIQSMLAAQFRADTIEQASRAQEETDARAVSLRFLGSGSAYARK